MPDTPPPAYQMVVHTNEPEKYANGGQVGHGSPDYGAALALFNAQDDMSRHYPNWTRMTLLKYTGRGMQYELMAETDRTVTVTTTVYKTEPLD